MKKMRKIAALLLAGAMVLTGCGGSGGSGESKTAGDSDGAAPSQNAGQPATSAASQAGGGDKTVMNLALSENITKLDPHDIFNFPVFTACWMMYDTLIATDHEGNYSPGLATEWSKSDDGLTWTFKLREGVKFQNGEDFDSADIGLLSS